MQYIKDIIFFLKHKEWDNLTIYIILGVIFGLPTPYLVNLLYVFFEVPLLNLFGFSILEKTKNYLSYNQWEWYFQFIADFICGVIIFWLILGRDSRFNEIKKQSIIDAQINIEILKLVALKKFRKGRLSIYGLWIIFIVFIKFYITPNVINCINQLR